MIAIAPTNSCPLCAPSHGVPLYYLFRWQSVVLEKINTQLILGTKTAFHQETSGNYHRDNHIDSGVFLAVGGESENRMVC